MQESIGRRMSITNRTIVCLVGNFLVDWKFINFIQMHFVPRYDCRKRNQVQTERRYVDTNNKLVLRKLMIVVL